MGEHQRMRIHPAEAEVDMEAAPPPTRSEKGVSNPHRPRKMGCSCCKCVCWTVTVIIVILIIIAACAGIMYLVFRPKIPKYSVDDLRISDLRVNPLDLSLYAKFNVRITAQNPNKKIGIYYEKGSRLSVWYKTTKLCQGSLPKLYQGHRNTTVLRVDLSGQSQAQYGNVLMSALQEAQQSGRVPLDLKIQVPVRIKVGRLKLMKVWILGDCMLIVNTLSTNTLITIKASTCNFKLKP